MEDSAIPNILRVQLARHQLLFEEKGIPSFQVASKVRALPGAYKMPVPRKLERQMSVLNINKDEAWSFFDGTSQGNQVNSSVGCALHQSKSYLFKMKATLGNGINQCCKYRLRESIGEGPKCNFSVTSA
jgi:hypothetical protein